MKLRELTLRKLKGLGPKSEQRLFEVGIGTHQQLKKLGAVRAYIRLQQQCSVQPGLNFLYTLAGAIEDRHWLDIAQTDKGLLLLELEAHAEYQLLLSGDISINASIK